ncbi:acyl-CoA dehydrogenase family protein [Alicyclobacillus cycloheptanicus]|uniref:Glutaryl-CoA dehydrogenase (Non-decarboxylating) n=1 Tax=Alicyclobacillus cycloheptanicus TaxID=1457 RepID=A0ABT9XI93_9BACL|nr:acyl-CoA dehydrogenase family protein [Alicyclobacillus cycloheptanicus]MDQ0189917.1 glutaryl-CoA dehydrogenase (non-decarboxylating) [Alicyclobacillus cycloheptanicus]WDM02180.1 acyl-CoA dehydrogenase family protein [Alicyclobacillus cycloheptanicus]
MLDFSLTEEQQNLQNMVRKFTKAEITPNMRQWDEDHHFDMGVVRKLADLGLMGVCIPEKYGGAGMDYNSLAIVCEELEYGDTAYRTAVSVHTGLNSMTVLQWGTEEQKEKYLKPQAQGKKLGAFGLTEPNAGSDAGSLQTRAVRDGDSYILNGSKIWISMADYADNFLIFATVDPDKKHRGVTAFIVERSFPGVTTRPIKGKLGIHGGDTGEVILEDVRVPAANRLGEEGEGFKIAMSALDNGRFTVAAGAAGLTRACLDASVEYAHQRHTFGVEIGKHQLVQQMIAKMEAGYQISQLLVYRAGWLKNKGVRNTRETSLAKWIASDVAFQSASDAIQIYGAYGYSNEYPVERYMRNAKALVIYEGTREIHTIMQAEYALGYRVDKQLNKMLPAWEGQAE